MDDSPFPFSDCDDLDLWQPELEVIDGAFGDVFRAFENPHCNPIDLAVIPADPAHPEHTRIFYRLRNRMLYLREKQVFKRCAKKLNLTSVFVLLEFFKDVKPIRWTRLPHGEHDVAWRKVYHIARERLVYFAANAYKLRTKQCHCLPGVRVIRVHGGRLSPSKEVPTCTEFVYPEYEAALKTAERESRGPWGYEMDVFMWIRRIVGNDLALTIIDYF